MQETIKELRKVEKGRQTGGGILGLQEPHWQGIWQPLPSSGASPTEEGNPSASNRKEEIKRMERIE